MVDFRYIFFVITQLVIFSKCFSQLNILIFGGNGFIGSECVRHLLDKNYNITLVNRGSQNYDYETSIKPLITHVKCDRYHGLQNCVPLNNIATKYDFVIDFSAYYPIVLEDALDYLKGRFDTYIYISTDSVYEVSIPSKNKLSKESDAIRYPQGPEQDKINNLDTYGHYKLQCEEVLEKEGKESNVKYIILRLPDVIGPRDTTFRWWAYQTVLQFYKSLKEPIIMPSFVTSSSYVYVKDVAKVISKIVQTDHNENVGILNAAYNLAFLQPITLRQLLDSLQQTLGVNGVEYKYSNDANYLYPSVFRGPIDVTKAIENLQWEPTSWLDAVNETVIFHKEAFQKFPNEMPKMLEKLKFLVSSENFQPLFEKIMEITNNDFTHFHEEQPKDEL